MKDYRKSNYAINKVSKNIVYKNDDGSFLEVTFEKLAEENPSFTAEDFKKLKELSDELYRREDRNDWKYDYYVRDTLDNYLNSKLLATLALEDEVINQADKEMLMTQICDVIDTKFTSVQRRRFFMYVVEGKTIREIAKTEGVSAMSVCESIQSATTKLKKILKNF